MKPLERAKLILMPLAASSLIALAVTNCHNQAGQLQQLECGDWALKAQEACNQIVERAKDYPSDASLAALSACASLAQAKIDECAEWSVW